MYTKLNTKTRVKPTPSNFYVGQVKGEVKKVRALWNRTSRRNKINSEQVDTTVLRKICSQIPFNQDKIAALARGEEPERSYLNSVYMVRVL